MANKLSPLGYFLLREIHSEVTSTSLFKSQSDLASFAVNVEGTSFSGKCAKSLRPYISQQLSERGKYNKPVRNHYYVYKKIVSARVKSLSNIEAKDIEQLLSKFDAVFEEHLSKRDEKVNIKGLDAVFCKRGSEK